MTDGQIIRSADTRQGQLGGRVQRREDRCTLNGLFRCSVPELLSLSHYLTIFVEEFVPSRTVSTGNEMLAGNLKGGPVEWRSIPRVVCSGIDRHPPAPRPQGWRTSDPILTS